ncbi:hypothetical protein E2C01_035513 [Portunus trituberculatus]|uniref:Uncharacterized protein n=1 Tax=Portunus trituberculatus TaxID=210409 RepID=A0A5B7FBP1_PORTR|nr:hypothetical protein [Portunus trituberculatus]
MIKVTCKQKGHKKKKKRPSGRESPASVTPPREVMFPATSEQPDNNIVTVPPSIHGYHFVSRGCSDVAKESWIQLQEC